MSALAFLEELRTKAWAMDAQRLEALAAHAAQASRLKSEELVAFFGRTVAREEPLYKVSGSAALIKVSGVLVQKKPAWYSWLGVDATETGRIKDAVTSAAKDESVDSIVLLVDSPGGEAQGVHEVAEAIAKIAGKGKTPVSAVVRCLCASGAYWIASQANTISAARDAFVGSIGVYQVVTDYSAAAEKEGVKVHVLRSGEHKGMGVEGAPITEKQLAAAQELVDAFADMFKTAVGRGRAEGLDKAGLDAKTVATGQLWLAGTAKTKGLIDKAESYDKALARLAPGNDDEQDDEEDEDAMGAKTTKTTTGDENEDPIETARADEKKRLADLKAAFPKDLTFAVEQYVAGSSVAEAKAAYAEVLAARLAEKDQELGTTKAELEKAKSGKPVPKAPPAGEPVPFAGSAGESGETQSDFVRLAKAKAKEDGTSFRVAAAALARENPEAHDSWIESQPKHKKGNVEGKYDRARVK